MTDFNPLAGAILGSTQAQNILGGEKQRQVRRAQNLRKDFAVREDHFEHQVESAEELHAIDDGNPDQSNPRQNQRQQRQDPDETTPQIDVKA